MQAAPRKSLEPFLKDEVEYYLHQAKGVRILARMPSFLLADDMGLGKSLQALTVFCIDVKLGKADTLIIICPVTLRENWAEEIEKFTRIPYTILGQEPHPQRAGVIRKLSPAKRQEQLVRFTQQTGPRILVCNYEQLVNPAHASTIARFKFSMAIFDEAHMIKNHKAQRTKAAQAVRSTRSGLLTGTPMLNHVNELWVLLNRIDPRRFPRYWAFVNRYCVFGGYENRQVIGVKNEGELKKILGEVMLRRLKNDTLDRENPTYIAHKMGLSDVQRKLYDEAKDEMQVTGSAGVLDIVNDISKFLRLKQICTTPYAIDPSFPDDSLKLDRVIEVTSELAERGDKFVLFTQFRGVLEAVQNRIHKAGTGPLMLLHGDVPPGERQGVVAEWSRVSGHATILCMLQVAGVGLNMVAASEAGFIDKLFVPGLNKQAVDRLDRIGQQNPVVVHEFITKGTVESRVEVILKTKEMLNTDIVEGGVGMQKLLQMLKESMKE